MIFSIKNRNRDQEELQLMICQKEPTCNIRSLHIMLLYCSGLWWNALGCLKFFQLMHYQGDKWDNGNSLVDLGETKGFRFGSLCYMHESSDFREDHRNISQDSKYNSKYLLCIQQIRMAYICQQNCNFQPPSLLNTDYRENMDDSLMDLFIYLFSFSKFSSKYSLIKHCSVERAQGCF